MCEEESDDAEAVAKLLEINDSIHRTIERYKLMKAGNVTAANQIAAGTLGTTTGVGKNAANELSLIDFDPEPPAPSGQATSNGSLLESAPAQTSTGQTSVEDDLLGLSLNSDSGPSGMISLGPSTNTNISSLPFSIAPQPPSVPTGSTGSPMASPPPQQPSKPNYDAFASLTSALPSSKPATPVPNPHQHVRPSSQAMDPFAALVSRGSRPSTPSSQRNVAQPATKPTSHEGSLLQLSQNPQAASTTGADDEWNFASSLPDTHETNTTEVGTSQIAMKFTTQRQVGQPVIKIQAEFSNNTMSAISGVHFQVAVEKSYSLQLKPQTGREMAPNQKNAIQQEILLSGVPFGKGNAVKMRFKISYLVNGQPHDEQGNIPPLGIA